MQWLTDRVRELADQVQADESAVQQYKADNGIIDTTTGGPLIDQQTASVSVQLINAKADLAQKRALLDRILQLRQQGRAVTASQVVDSQLIAQLRTQDADLARQEAQLSSRYLPLHPKLVEVVAQRRSNQEKLSLEVDRVVETLANDVAVARANVESLVGSLEQLQTRFQTKNAASVQLKALESIATSSRALYETFLSKLKEVQGQEHFATPDARIISTAMVPLVSSPRASVVLAIATPAGLLLGVFFALLAEGFTPKLRTAEQTSNALGTAVLSEIPQEQGSRSKIAALVLSAQQSLFANSIRRLYLGLGLNCTDNSIRTVLIASPRGHEGKTVTACSLARFAASKGRRTLLIDGSHQNPAMAITLGLDPSRGGLLDALAQQLPVEQCVVKDPLSNVDVLFSSISTGTSLKYFDIDSFGTLLTRLKSVYELIIVDTDPVINFPETQQLAGSCDKVVLVTQSGKTSQEDAVTACNELKSAGATIAGVVVSGMPLDRSSSAIGTSSIRKNSIIAYVQ
jgi:capsular exopolysaccharide synthesis family protein